MGPAGGAINPGTFRRGRSLCSYQARIRHGPAGCPQAVTADTCLPAGRGDGCKEERTEMRKMMVAERAADGIQRPLEARAVAMPVVSSRDTRRMGLPGLGLLLLTVLLVVLLGSLMSVTAQGAPVPAVQDPAPPQTPRQHPASPQTRPSRPEPTIESYVDGDPIVKLIPKDAISPIDDPRMVSAEEAEAFMRDEEMVIGVFDGKEARAYSTWHLDRHEVVNDRLSETPIAATW